MNSDRHNDKYGKSRFWERYGDLMLVGDHGQVVPFQRFRKITIIVLTSLVISLILVVILGILLAISSTRYLSLKNTLKETQQQLAQLRDEKDLLLTQMVIKKKRIIAPVTPQETPTKIPLQEKKVTDGGSSVVPTDIKAPPQKKEPPPPPKKVPVKLSADARNIKVRYQSDRHVLSISYRIFNTTKPKVPLAGRSVVVFKNQDDPPIKWLVVPRVQLVDGKPSGKRGKSFKINNYRTEKLRAYQQKAPVRYNMATIFIYSSKGELLLSKDHSFKIEVKASPKPVIPAPKPVKEASKPKKIPAPKPIEKPSESSVISSQPATGPAQSQPAIPTGQPVPNQQTTPAQPVQSEPAVPGTTDGVNPSTGNVENDALTDTAPPTENSTNISPSSRSSEATQNPIGQEAQPENDVSQTESEKVQQPTMQGEQQ